MYGGISLLAIFPTTQPTAGAFVMMADVVRSGGRGVEGSQLP